MKEDRKEELKGIAPEVLERHGFLIRSQDGKFVCPHCGNGSHDDGTGIDFIFQDGVYKSHCFACDTDFDNIKIFAEVWGLNWQNPIDFRTIMQRATAKFFDGDNSTYSTNTPPPHEKPKADFNNREDFSATIEEAKKNLHDFITSHGGAYRAITEPTYQHADCGYLPKYSWRKIPALILPSSKHHYQARFLDPDAKYKYLAPKNSIKDIFLFKDLLTAEDGEIVFCVEGYIDALSIYQAGFKAIALSGKKIADFMQIQLKSLTKKPRFIVAFDRDDLQSEKDKQGRIPSDVALETLTSLGFEAVKLFLPATCKTPDDQVVAIKDFNDFLQANPDDFKMTLEDLVNRAEFAFDNPKTDDKDNDDEDFQQKQNSFFGGDEYLTSKTVDPNCPVDVVIPEDFAMARDGSIWMEFKTHAPECVLPLPLVISARRCDTNFSNFQYDIAWKKFGKTKWRKITDVFGHEIADARALARVLSHNGIQVDSKQAGRLSTYFARMINDPDNASRIPEKIYYTKTGWTDNTFTQFIYPTDKDGDCPIQNGNFGFDTAFQSAGDAKTQIALLARAMLEGSKSRQIIGSILTAPLIRPLGKSTRNLLFHIHGPSASGKTADTMLAMSIFGNPEELKGSFADTNKYILERASKFNDLPVYNDEFQALDIYRRDHFDEWIYSLEMGKTRGRLRKDLSATEIRRSYYSFISTGEQPITTQKANQGAINRVLQIDAKDALSPRLATEIYRSIGDNFGHFGKQFIKFLTNQKNLVELRDFYTKIFDTIQYRSARINGYKKDFDYFRQFRAPYEVIGLIDNHVHAETMILTALHAFAQAVFAVDADYKDVADFIERMIDCDIDDFIKNSYRSKITSNAERWLPVVLETAFSDPARFGYENVKGEFWSGERGVDNLGFIKQDNSILVFPHQLRKLIKNVGAPSDDEILQGFHDLGVLDEGNCKAHLFQKKLSINCGGKGNRNQWFYVFKPNAEELVEQNKQRIIEELLA